MGGAAPPRQPSPDHPRQTLQGNDGSTPLTSTTGKPLVQLDPAKLIKKRYALGRHRGWLWTSAWVVHRSAASDFPAAEIPCMEWLKGPSRPHESFG